MTSVSHLGPKPSALARWEAALAKAARSAGPPLLFGLRLWASVCLALSVAFWLELDNPYWAGTSAAIVCLPELGASLRKAHYRVMGTIVGAVVIVALTAVFPQDRVGFFILLALWCGICAIGATVFRNFASYASSLAGYTTTIIVADTLGATGGPSSEVFMLAITRSSEILIGIACAGVIVTGMDFGGAQRRLAELFASLSAEIAGRFGSTLALAGSASFDPHQPMRRELIRQAIALDPVMDQATGESSHLRYVSPVLQAAIDGLYASLAAWRNVATRLVRLPSDLARQEAEYVVESIPVELRSAPPVETTPWLADPIGLRRRCDAAIRQLLAMPADTPSLRLVADQTANVLLGFAAVLDGLALLIADPARSHVRGRRPRLYVADWLPPLISGARAFVAIGALELFWVVTAWPSGVVAIIIAAVVILLLSPRGDLAPSGAIVFTLGAAIAITATAIIEFAVLPRIQTFPAFCLALGLYLVPVGFGMARCRHPALLALLNVMALVFVPILQPTNQMTYDTLQFYNTALAIFTGCVAASLSFILMPALAPAVRTKRLLALTLRDLRHLATDGLDQLPDDWEGRLYNRLAAVPDAAEPLVRAQLVMALSVGTEIIELRQIAQALGFKSELDPALDALAQGDSATALARFEQLDQHLTAVPHAAGESKVTLHERGLILLICDALVQYRDYFDAGAGG